MTADMRAFRRAVRAHYTKWGRHDLPWRNDIRPYSILVSEYMLQQTQVERVIPKYNAFMHEYPTIEDLARAPLAHILTVWQGLGYNRRAKLLHDCAHVIMTNHNGDIPDDACALRALPGVGPYTAGALSAFAYNKVTDVPLIETNIRTAYIYHFFPSDEHVSDTQILPIVSATCDIKNPREWYWALMDYGAYIKRTVGNHGARSSRHTKQSTFKGSRREARGAIVRMLVDGPRRLLTLKRALSDMHPDALAQLDVLVEEGLLERKGSIYSLSQYRAE